MMAILSTLEAGVVPTLLWNVRAEENFLFRVITRREPKFRSLSPTYVVNQNPILEIGKNSQQHVYTL